jgi:vancomycin permeability regulator SanA
MASSPGADPSRTGARRRTLLSFATLTWRPLVSEVQAAGQGRIFDAADAPVRPVALVLGAMVREMKPTAVLEDRVLTAARLFREGKAARLLLSGTPDEVAVMTRLLAEHDVPGDAQLLDPRGTHTFESVRNARALGHRSLLIVSQRFHLPRALYLAGRMGIDAVGVAADLRHYAALKKMEQREVFSSVLAYWMARATS